MNNILSTIGLCRRAGLVVSGFDAVVKEATSEKTKVAGIFAVSDISEKTYKELNFKVKDVPIVKLPVTMEEVQTVFLKRVGIIAVLDEGFYKTLSEMASKN